MESRLEHHDNLMQRNRVKIQTILEKSSDINYLGFIHINRKKDFIDSQ